MSYHIHYSSINPTIFLVTTALNCRFWATQNSPIKGFCDSEIANSYVGKRDELRFQKDRQTLELEEEYNESTWREDREAFETIQDDDQNGLKSLAQARRLLRRRCIVYPWNLLLLLFFVRHVVLIGNDKRSCHLNWKATHKQTNKQTNATQPNSSQF